jgi:peptide/nickel transport system substrate-binding protein
MLAGGTEARTPTEKCTIMKLLPLSPLWLVVVLVAAASGCSSERHQSDAGKAAGEKAIAADEESADSGEVAGSDKPFVLGDMIEPFTPPTLAELDAKAEWTESPVVDAMERLREAKKDEPPLVTVAEALAMRNDSPEANKKIISALSEVAPADGQGVNFDATFNRALTLDLRSINALLTSSIAEIEIAQLTSFNMFSYDWNMTPFAVSSCVKSWQTSKDHMVDKVIMRDDLVWSDGKPITAHDVAFSFKLILSSAVPVPALRTGTDDIAWVEAYDDHTVVYFHKHPLATNIWNLNFFIAPKHIYEKSVFEDPTLRSTTYHRNLERNPVSGGAYEVTHWNRGQEVLLRRRENWYMQGGKQVRAKPYFDQMRFRIIEDGNTRLLALKSGDIEESELEAEQWVTQTAGDDFYRENTKASAPEWMYMYIGWNMDTAKVPFFGDLRVRQAMAYALNYREMLDDLCYGLYTQSTGIWDPDSWMYPKDPAKPFAQDLDKAEDLLDAAGWVDSDGDGIRDKEINGRVVPFEFSLAVSNKPDRIAICNLFRENLESIGVICNVTPLEAAVFQQRMFEKNYEAGMAGWATGADPSSTRNIFGTGQQRNFGSYSNPEVDKLFEEAKRAFDPAKQAELYGEIHNLIYADQPYLFLYNKHALYGFNKKLRGYRFSPRGPFHYSPGIESIWSP